MPRHHDETQAAVRSFRRKSRSVLWLRLHRLRRQQCHVLIAELAPEHADDPERATVNSVLQAEYARLAGIAPAALTAAMQPCLPIVRVFLLLGGAMPEMRERLIQRVEAALRSAG
ncbi:hypothetical protein [Bradyrhizobium pachyrhizi]|uniref:hypothetical protein n=1 Tax=Bradyrhizobium pachyrhizi TaxID=280333 RepID=UPI003D3675C5